MKKYNYLIVGGGVAGTTAAETIRGRDKSGSIAIVSDEPCRFYSRIMLSKPNFFLGKIPFEQIWLKNENWYPQNSVELLAGRKAVRLDAQKKEVTLDDNTVLGYEKLLVAIGGCARAWNVDGSLKRGIFNLRTLDDAQAVIAAVKTARRAVAIGGGFISFEMCEMLKMAGLDVSLILRESHYWEPLLDEPSGRMIEAALAKGGVKIFKNAEVREIVGDQAVEAVILKDGTRLPCEMVMVGIGVYCPFAWVEAAGVAVNRGIVANEYLETNVPDVWTAGDDAEFNDLVLGELVQLGNWVNAQMQGRTAGLNMTGDRKPFKLVSFYTTQGFGITIAFVGDVRPAPDRAVITRGSAESGSYGRILAWNGKIIGATLINRTDELSIISKLIEKNTPVAGREKELNESAFDLRTLVH